VFNNVRNASLVASFGALRRDCKEMQLALQSTRKGNEIDYVRTASITVQLTDLSSQIVREVLLKLYLILRHFSFFTVFLRTIGVS